MAESSVNSIDISDSSINNTMNLTGCPLEVDLNVLPSAAAHHLTGHQNLHEVPHLPMKLETARKCICDYQIHSEELVQNKLAKAIYCVCDGTDMKRIVAIGSYQSRGDIVRTLCFLEDCVDESYPAENINGMIQKHYVNVGTDTVEIETKVTCIYELYGFQMSNDNVLEDLENTGSVFIEGCWNSCAYNIPKYGAALKMRLQSIIGHDDSVMHPFFNELVFLQHCLTILSNKRTLADAIISSSPGDVADIIKKMSEILHAVNIIKKPSRVLNSLEDVIQNVSEMSLTDKLYDVMKGCEKVDDLRICFDHLFEIVSGTPVRLQLYGNDQDTVVGRMIADVSSGKLTVGYLAPEQSLELLIELGIQKLKQKYFLITKSFDFTTSEQLKQNWHNVGTFLTESRRGTFVGHNLNQGCLQLQFLLHVHVSLEFLQLVEKNCCFSRDTSISVMKYACNKYVIENKLVEVSMIERKQLCDLEVPLMFADIKLIGDCCPMKWQMKMTSHEKFSSVVTVFHYSKKSIFPNTIYNGYDADTSTGDTKEKFFAARLERYSDKIY